MSKYCSIQACTIGLRATKIMVKWRPAGTLWITAKTVL